MQQNPGVCDSENDMGYTSYTREAKLLVQAIQASSPKGESKLSEFQLQQFMAD